MRMIDEGTDERKVTALLIQRLGKAGDFSYSVFWEDERGRQRCYQTTSDDFYAILDKQGQATYQEPGYWSYEVQS